ncbi:HAMP domain-containing sensor histidine kinase [Actinomycetes bacterium KLBMP 9797]
MIAEWAHLTSPLGRRLLFAFVLVAMSSVVVLTVAALVATDRGLASARQEERQRTADRVSAAAGVAYREAGGWAAADLGPASALADAAGARLAVRDRTGTMVWPGRGMGPGMAGMHGGVVVEAAVTIAGERVGGVLLTFTGDPADGRAVAWSWVAGAAVVALAVALPVSAYVGRRLTRPLVALAAAARRFAAGDRSARARLAAPGELGEVARAFDSMADEVVRAETVRRRLAADVAHELRTPLAALQAGLEELRDGLRAPDAIRLAELHDQSLRLGRVVTDLADLAAAEAAAVSLRMVRADLADIARAALAAERPHLDAVGVAVGADLERPVSVRADPDRLHQAITNLLANAARYCRPGDAVDLAVRAESGGAVRGGGAVGGGAAGGSAVLTVADTGPGIPADELPHAFDRMWRGRAARAVTGTGIGLAVVRELVAAHGGTVDLDSPTGGGLTVTIRLPLAARHP